MQHMSPQMQWGNDKAHQLYIENRLAVGEVMEVSPNGLHFYSCNMGTSGLPDMYIRCPRAAGPGATDVHIRQITSAYVTTIM